MHSNFENKYFLSVPPFAIHPDLHLYDKGLTMKSNLKIKIHVNKKCREALLIFIVYASFNIITTV